uniref:RxLR effector protein n=1 Tax=Peronospora matthiolae TaxID=2874970 RepID=A0AAV1UML4_9STRA
MRPSIILSAALVCLSACGNVVKAASASENLIASHETSPAMAGDAVVDTNVNTTKRRDHVRTPETGSPADAMDGKGNDEMASYDDHPGMTRVSGNDDSSERSLDFFSESGGKPNHRMFWYAADYVTG